MNADVSAYLADHEFISRPQIIAIGLDDRAITRFLAAGSMHRIGPGLYAAPGYPRLTPEQQHIVRCHAIATRFKRHSVVFSHQTAACLLGVAVWGFDLTQIHITRRDDGRGRRQAGVTHHVARFHDSELVEVDGLLVSTAPRCAWELAIQGPREASLVSSDSVLHQELATYDDLRTVGFRHSYWRGAARAKAALSMSDGRSASPGETRTRLRIIESALPKPVLQFKVFDELGQLAGIADFAWPEYRHLAEFDGLMKYGDAKDLAREKRREDQLRRLGWGMTRIVWSQLATGFQRTLVDELGTALNQSRSLYGALSA